MNGAAASRGRHSSAHRLTINTAAVGRRTIQGSETVVQLQRRLERADIKSIALRTQVVGKIAINANIFGKMERSATRSQRIVVVCIVGKARIANATLAAAAHSAAQIAAVAEEEVRVLGRCSAPPLNSNRMVGDDGVGDADGAGIDIDRRATTQRRVGNGVIEERGRVGAVAAPQRNRAAFLVERLVTGKPVVE